MKIQWKLGRDRLRAHVGGSVDLLVRLVAPAAIGTEARPPIAVAPVVDVSGSMAGSKLLSVQGALRKLVLHLQPGDWIGLVTFDSSVHVPLPLVEVTHARKDELLRAVDRLRPGSNTNLAGGLARGIALCRAAPLPDHVRARIILLTDGLANEGPAVGYANLQKFAAAELATGSSARPVSLSAFGYGNDCDQALLGDLAASGGGSYAYIGSDDVVLSAFGRELGGLADTYASGVRLRVDALAGESDRAPLFDEPVADLLYDGEQSHVVQVSIAARAPAASTPIARIEVRYVDRQGRPETARAEASAALVLAGEDRSDDAEVVRARDERTLRIAQEKAEACARAGDFPGARAAVHDAIARLADTALLEFAREVLLPCYGNASEYVTGSGVRAGTLAALRKTRIVTSVASVESAFRLGKSESERRMERSFTGAGEAPPSASGVAKITRETGGSRDPEEP